MFCIRIHESSVGIKIMLQKYLGYLYLTIMNIQYRIQFKGKNRSISFKYGIYECLNKDTRKREKKCGNEKKKICYHDVGKSKVNKTEKTLSEQVSMKLRTFSALPEMKYKHKHFNSQHFLSILYFFRYSHLIPYDFSHAHELLNLTK